MLYIMANNYSMQGVTKGVYICQQERVDELNNRISARTFPSASLQPQYSLRPTSTKYSLMPIVDQRVRPTIPLATYPVYNPKHTFNPGNAQAPWSGFSTNINTESKLRNQFFALQRGEQHEYVPESASDLYTSQRFRNTTNEITHAGLFKPHEFASFNPNPLNLGGLIFHNSTRAQLQDSGEN